MANKIQVLLLLYSLCIYLFIFSYISGAATWTPLTPSDDITADDSVSNVGTGREYTGEDFPSLGLPRSLTEKQSYTVSKLG